MFDQSILVIFDFLIDILVHLYIGCEFKVLILNAKTLIEKNVMEYTNKHKNQLHSQNLSRHICHSIRI